MNWVVFGKQGIKICLLLLSMLLFFFSFQDVFLKELQWKPAKFGHSCQKNIFFVVCYISEIECGPFRTPSSMAGLPPQALPFLTDFRYLGSSGSQSCSSYSVLVGITQIKCHTYANITTIPVCQISDRGKTNVFYFAFVKLFIGPM